MKKIRNFQREDVTGFADAGATSSNYQSTLSPVGSVSPKQMRKKAKSVKEAYNRAIVEAAKVCPKCDNTGTFRQFGNTFPCDACGGDVRSANSAIIGTQARDMLATGKTTPVKEEVITSLDQITPVLEAYKPSDKLESRTKHLVRPKLSKMLQDRSGSTRARKERLHPITGHSEDLPRHVALRCPIPRNNHQPATQKRSLIWVIQRLPTNWHTRSLHTPSRKPSRRSVSCQQPFPVRKLAL